MKRIGILALLAVLSIAGAVPASAQKRMTPRENARQAHKDAKKQQKMLNKANKKQRKAAKKYEKQQRKATKKANKSLNRRRS
jgi:hypothetical protein